MLFALSALLFSVIAVKATAVEHPGVLHEGDNCTRCHLDKTRGKSVHSVMRVSCTVCHLTQTQGDLTTLNLMMPKEKICFACHEHSLKLQRHTVKGTCLACHDAHRSDRPMLLVDQLVTPAKPARPKPSVHHDSNHNHL